MLVDRGRARQARHHLGHRLLRRVSRRRNLPRAWRGDDAEAAPGSASPMRPRRCACYLVLAAFWWASFRCRSCSGCRRRPAPRARVVHRRRARRCHAVHGDLPPYPLVQAGVLFLAAYWVYIDGVEHGDPDGGRLRQVDRLRHAGPDPRRAAGAVRRRAGRALAGQARRAHRAAPHDLHRPRRVLLRLGVRDVHESPLEFYLVAGHGRPGARRRAAPQPLVFRAARAAASAPANSSASTTCSASSRRSSGRCWSAR